MRLVFGCTSRRDGLVQHCVVAFPRDAASTRHCEISPPAVPLVTACPDSRCHDNLAAVKLPFVTVFVSVLLTYVAGVLNSPGRTIKWRSSLAGIVPNGAAAVGQILHFRRQ
jgi:hypothetical protein